MKKLIFLSFVLNITGTIFLTSLLGQGTEEVFGTLKVKGTPARLTVDSSITTGSIVVDEQIQIKGGTPGIDKVLTSDASGNATWETPATGDVVGPASSTDNALARYNLTTGKLIQNSVGVLSDAGALSGLTLLTVAGGSAGIITPAVGTIATLENSANTYLSILSPDANERGIFFGEPTSSLAGAIIYNNSATLDGLQFRTNGNNTRMVIRSNGDVGIGTTSPNAKLEIIGPSAGTVGGFAAGLLHVRGNGTTQFSNAVITGHSSFAGNTQLWYFGSTSSSNDNIAFINRQNGTIDFFTNNTPRVTIATNGDIKFSAYPNTRDDGTPINMLGTDASGNLISGPNAVLHIGGSFVDTIDQTITVASTGQTIKFRKTILVDNISHTTDSVFTINTDGIYDLIIAPQLAQGSGAATVEFWVEKNGVIIAHSNKQETIGANSQSLPFLRWKERFVVNDILKIIWASNSINTMLDNIASTYGGPNIPAIHFGITHIGN